MRGVGKELYCLAGVAAGLGAVCTEPLDQPKGLGDTLPWHAPRSSLEASLFWAQAGAAPQGCVLGFELSVLWPPEGGCVCPFPTALAHSRAPGASVGVGHLANVQVGQGLCWTPETKGTNAVLALGVIVETCDRGRPAVSIGALSRHLRVGTVMDKVTKACLRMATLRCGEGDMPGLTSKV